MSVIQSTYYKAQKGHWRTDPSHVFMSQKRQKDREKLTMEDY